MTRRRFSLVYKILVLLSLTIGVTLNMIRTTSAPAQLSYYTMQSNILCMITYILFVVFEIKGYTNKLDTYYLIKGAITVAIFVTACVYICALAPNNFEMGNLHRDTLIKWVSNMFVHGLSPFLVISDYFLFDEKGHFKWHYPLVWILIQGFYIVYVYLYSNLGGRFFGIGGSRKFAYFFLDYEKIGYFEVIKWLAFFTICILFVSYLFVFFDRKMKRR